MRGFLNGLGRDSRGTAVIELSLVAPVLALLVVGIVDMGNAFSHKLALEQGAQRAVEKIMQTTGTDTVENTLADEVRKQVNGVDANGDALADPISASEVTVDFTLECTDTDGAITTMPAQTDPALFDAQTCANETDKESRYIAVTVQDDYTPMFPIHFFNISDSDKYHLSATAGMRTQ
jgi:Flp pilus assembly protein TadG